MAFIDGYLALCTAVATGACTEASVPGYARQPISFGQARNGVSVSATSWSFGFPKPGQLAGRAVFDAPTGGNLLLLLPFAGLRPTPGGGPADYGDVGDISITIAAMQAFTDGAAFSGLLAAGSVIGSTFDRADVVGSIVANGGGGYQLVTNASPLSSGVALAANRGVLAAHGAFVS